MHSATLIITLAFAAVASARPRAFGRRAEFTLQNGKDALALNDKFKTLTATSACTTGEDACVNNQFAQCVGTTFALQPCAGGTICAALPLVNKAGTSITCTTQADLDARIAATGATAADATAAAPPAAADTGAAAPPPAAADSGDLQSSLTLDKSIIQSTDDGQNPPVAGQTGAAVSKNNFINFCQPTLKTLPLTNGLQITTGSCNQTPIGQIPSADNIPSAKFQSPTNGAVLKANTAFTITLGAKNIQLGTFTNAAKTYYANPQTLNAQGQVIGHTHIVIEAVDSLDSTKLSNPLKFLFFKGINNAADAKGNVEAAVTAGLPVGTYRMGTIMSSSTHQPVIAPVAQHGLIDDVIYMTVTADGNAAGGAAAAPAAAAPAVAAVAAPAAAAPATAAAGGPAFDPAGVPHVGNGKGEQFIGGQCLAAADCASGCCAGPSGICSGPGAATQAGKTGCGFVAPK